MEDRKQGQKEPDAPEHKQLMPGRQQAAEGIDGPGQQQQGEKG